MQKKYNRVVLKLSGEALAGDLGFGIDPKIVSLIAEEIVDAHQLGAEIAIIVGGGNIWRGKTASELGMDRSSADYMGMLATIMNALALQDALEKRELQTRVLSSINMQEIAEPYIRRRAIRHLEKGRIVIFAGGTGNPYFSTDTTAALRAAEINADVILMAKNNVDGVYSADPKTDPNAEKFTALTHQELLNKELGVMDLTASTLCKDNNLKLVVFSMMEKGSIKRAIAGEDIGTVIAG